jgi:thiol:disulfide interchange protein
MERTKEQTNERTKDRSVSGMPKPLLFASAILLTLRIVSLGANAIASPQALLHTQDRVSWTELPGERVRNSGAVRAATVKAPTETKPAILLPFLAKSRSDNKLLLCEFSADWSDPCKRMESTSLNNPQITEIIAQHFRPIKITDTQKESGSNPPPITELYKKYRIFAFPTLVVVDEEGEQVASQIGNCSSLSTYRFLSHALFTQKMRKD